MDNQKKQKLQDSSKEIYDSIIIPTELEEIVKKSIESVDKEAIDMHYKNSSNNVSVILKYFGSAAAIIFLSIIIGLNSSETFAREMWDVPVLGTVARVFTVRKYEVEKEELILKEEIPKVEVATESEIEETPVEVSGNNVQEEIDVVSGNDVSGNNSNSGTKMTVSGNDIVAVTGEEKKVIDTLDQPSGPVTVSGNAAYDQAISVGDYSADINKTVERYMQKYISDEATISYEIKYQRGAIVSFVITVVQNGDSASEEKYFYNLDLLNGKNVILSDLLGNNYSDVANVQILRQMKERVKENPGYVYWGVTDEGELEGFEGFKSVNADTKFYINAAGHVVIVFENYEIAPGFMGMQEFQIVVERK